MPSKEKVFDVAILGGGPAGATLGSRLAAETNLSVAIFEASRFPRDHVGESLIHTVVPALQESGALAKVLASSCYIKKGGGFYSWDEAQPWATYFEHALQQRDGYLRWALHVNRSEFDSILLDHARSTGVEVFEGAPIENAIRDDEMTTLELSDGRRFGCRIFVNSGGRSVSSALSGERSFLSRYRNVAIWNHVIGGRPAQSLPGHWNIFRERDLSPIGSFACEEGWFWYVPVPKQIAGKRVTTHSLGLVTDPAVLKSSNGALSTAADLIETARRVPLLGDLVADVTPLSDGVHAAAGYSRISKSMCSWESREIRIGDAAFFVDPLFSSGVHFALLHAGMAVVLIKTAFDESVDEPLKRELWNDYHETLRDTARSFALVVDQWYAEISRDNPHSVHWRERSETPTFDTRQDTFHALVNGRIHPDVMRVLTKGTNRVQSLGTEGALLRTLREVGEQEPSPCARIALRPDVRVKPSLTLEDGSTSRDGRPTAFEHGPYWENPALHADEVRPLFSDPVACHRFYFSGGCGRGSEVKFVDAIHGGLELYDVLTRERLTYGELKRRLAPSQRHILLHLVLAGMLSE